MSNKNPWLGKDPEAKQEAERYQDPVPSRAYLLEWLAKQPGPVSLEQVCRACKLSSEQQIEAMRRRLLAMVRDGQLLVNRKGLFGLIAKLSLVVGRVRAHADGHGLLKPEQGGKDIYLPAVQMRRAMDGDKLAVRPEPNSMSNRPSGQIVEVLERAHKQLVGRLYKQSGIAYLTPENPRIRNEVLISNSLGALDGDVVVVEIDSYGDARRQSVGHVVEVLGEHMAPGMEINMAIRTYDLPFEWADSVQAEIDALPDAVREQDLTGRVDLRDKPFVTIDGEDARDFDDAVLATKRPGGGYRLLVAIADVSHYVRPGSELDVAAFERANSVYFPGRVLPMLPEKLSNGLCSLKPEVDRLAMVCDVTLSEDAQIEHYQFYEAVIHSKGRLTYTQVAALLSGQDDSAADRFANRDRALVRPLKTLYGLYQQLVLQRKTRGAIEFETQEPIIVFNADRKIERIESRDRNDAHKLIEEAMLVANQCAADLFVQLEQPCLYRVHEGPTDEKLENLVAWLAGMGLMLPGGRKPEPKDLRELLASVQGRPDAEEVQTMLLRSMSQAQYHPENLGHFGLAFKAYTHFTSPIRRYADLVVHRAVRGLLQSGRRHPSLRRLKQYNKLPFAQNYPYEMQQLLEIGEQTSMSERRADEATRDVLSWLKCEYMQERLGQELSGKVSGVRPFGLFVQLDEHFVDGMLHISALGQDYYHFDQQRQVLVGERTGKVWRLGQPVQVVVARVNLDERKIDFDLVGVEASKPSKASKRQGGKPQRAKPQGQKPASGKPHFDKAKKGHAKKK